MSLTRKEQDEHERLCLAAMEESEMSPEDFGAKLYDAVDRRTAFDPRELRERSSAARKWLLSLSGGSRIWQLERKLLGI